MHWKNIALVPERIILIAAWDPLHGAEPQWCPQAEPSGSLLSGTH